MVESHPILAAIGLLLDLAAIGLIVWLAWPRNLRGRSPSTRRVSGAWLSNHRIDRTEDHYRRLER